MNEVNDSFVLLLLAGSLAMCLWWHLMVLNC